MTLKFYTSLTKGLKLKVRKFWWLIPTFVEVTGEKLVGMKGVFSCLSLEDKGLEKALIEWDLKPLAHYVLWYNLVSVMVDGI